MKVAVIGIGTAGLQTLAYYMDSLPDDIEVYSIHNPAQKILGIGESTTTFLPHILQRSCDFTMLGKGKLLDVTTKHGVKYSNWREHSFTSNILPPYHGMHFNNFKLADIVLEALRPKSGFYEIKGEIKSMTQNENFVMLNIDDNAYTFDYVVDCRGYPEDYSDYKMLDYLPVNHGIVNGIDEPGTWQYTHHQATRNGWMFGIPLQTRQGWGYLFNDTITSVEEAKEDMQTLFDKPLSLREFSWKNYYKENIVDGRIISQGNRALFFEPLEALSGTYYEAVCVESAAVILGEKTSTDANKKLQDIAETYCSFICFVYHGGSTFNTEFWKQTVDKTSEALHNSPYFKDVVVRIKSLVESNFTDERIILYPISVSLWLLIDREMGYNYFK
jgi:hypothetical protein